MTPLTPTPALRSTLLADAALCGAVGLLQAAVPGLLSSLTGLEAGLIQGTGVFLVAFGVLLAWLGTRASLPTLLLTFVIAGNLAWVLACAGLAWARPLPSLGLAFLGIQALATAALAILETFGLRRSRAFLPATR